MRHVVLLLLAVSVVHAWYAVAPMPAARYGAAAVRVGDEGFVLGGSDASGVKTRSLLIYHHCNNSWTTGDSMLVARHRFGACVTGSGVFAFGGWDNGGVLLGHAEYLPSGGAWTEIESLPTPRGSLMAASVGGRTYAIGGWDGSQPFATVEEFDPGTGQWTAKRSMPTARSEAAVAVADDLVYVIGGTTDGTDVLDIVEVYDPAADSWYARAPIPTARAQAGCVEVGGRICVFGGVGPDLTGSRAVELYEPALDTWTTGESLPSPRRSLTGFSLFGTRVYAVGGLDSLLQPTTLNERWDPPAAIAEPGRPVPAVARTARFCRPGEPLPGPADIYSALGRRVARAESTCPDLAPGSYFSRSEADPAWSRLVVVR